MEPQETLPPTILVIFGITGDLSHRYLLPALTAIVNAGHVKDDFTILGVSRRATTAQEVIPSNCSELKAKTQMLQMDVNNETDYENLKQKIADINKDYEGKAQVIFYLVVPPVGVPAILQRLGKAGLNSKNIKLLLEKPFGTDLESARQLIDKTAAYFDEAQVYRIDHYLAKEMSQNITVFLGSNSIFRNIWNKEHVEKIEIDVLERIGIEGRAEFYEANGALRDIIQSHGLQLAALTLMEPCSDIFDYEEIPRRRLEALKHLKIEDTTKVEYGQYQGYTDDAGVEKSNTETFVRLELSSSDPKWDSVPITLTTGKRLDRRLTEIRVVLRPTGKEKANVLRLRVQPKEAIEIDLWVKQPGYSRQLQQLPLEFSYKQYFDDLPNAYEQVLIDAMNGNHSLFAGSGEILSSWEILAPVLKHWEKSGKHPKKYEQGSTSEQVIDSRI
jgi:glucose-6-phosphate 1-dehydrogenase